MALAISFCSLYMHGAFLSLYGTCMLSVGLTINAHSHTPLGVRTCRIRKAPSRRGSGMAAERAGRQNVCVRAHVRVSVYCCVFGLLPGPPTRGC